MEDIALRKELSEAINLAYKESKEAAIERLVEVYRRPKPVRVKAHLAPTITEGAE